ncbi:MAG: hypothetical protein H0X30_16080 [Anaerolineae bacterium]|nr:hypothetical protein [Anaerolineae bacterium]
MADFVTLSCPNCGGKLQVTPDIDRFAGSHCGVEQIVKRGGGIISLSPVIDAITKVQTSVDFIAEDIRLRRDQEAKAQEKIASELRVRREKEVKAQEKIVSELAIKLLKGEITRLQNILIPLQDKKNKNSVKQLKAAVKGSIMVCILLVLLAIGLGTGALSSSSKSATSLDNNSGCIGGIWIAAIAFGATAYSTRKKANVAATTEINITKEIFDKQTEIKNHETIIKQQP